MFAHHRWIPVFTGMTENWMALVIDISEAQLTDLLKSWS
jgi:hypothetical protein